jgi:hypothetical protein
LGTFFPEALFNLRLADLLHEEFLEWVAVKTHLLFGKDVCYLSYQALDIDIYPQWQRNRHCAVANPPPPLPYAQKETARQDSKYLTKSCFW